MIQAYNTMIYQNYTLTSLKTLFEMGVSGALYIAQLRLLVLYRHFQLSSAQAIFSCLSYNQ